ncbi:MAG: hypothetical protein LC797_14120 [Chloroflexi bacterium]|nr:hypothetical protein [Chloroflexota bacterium]
MACPDELTLDLWLADALPSEEAATIAAHVPTCATCLAATRAVERLGAELHTALALDSEELRYLSELALASTWRTAPAATEAPAWGWIALIGVVAGFAAWLIAAPVVGPAVAVAVQIGAFTVLLNAALGLVLGFGQALLEVIQSPALGLAQPLLALLALALLFWPPQFRPQRSTHS